MTQKLQPYFERMIEQTGRSTPGLQSCRAKYGIYPEYHTSLDDLSLVTQRGLEGALAVYRRAIEYLEASRIYRAVQPCEPQLGKRGLYPTTSTRESGERVRTMMNLLAYADGENDLLAIAETIGADVGECATIAETLRSHGLLELVG